MPDTALPLCLLCGGCDQDPTEKTCVTASCCVPVRSLLMVCPRGTPRLGCGHGMGRCVTLVPGLPVNDSWVPQVFVCPPWHSGDWDIVGPLPISEPLCKCVHTYATSSWGHSDYYSYPCVLAGISTPEAGNNGDMSLNRDLLWSPISRPAPLWLPDLGQEE